MKDDKTTLDDDSICFFCNFHSKDLKENIIHMNSAHNFDVPFPKFLKDVKEFIKILSKKLFVYHSCLTCDIQNFMTNKALQNHMVRGLKIKFSIDR